MAFLRRLVSTNVPRGLRRTAAAPSVWSPNRRFSYALDHDGQPYPDPFLLQDRDDSVLRILMLGAPGSGKGTFCEILSKHLDLPHIATGDLVRAAAKSQDLSDPLVAQCHRAAKSGELVDDQVISAMLMRRLMAEDTMYGHRFLLDGFPRTLAQASFFTHEWLLDAGYPQAHVRSPFHLVVNLQLDEEIIVAKVIGRRVCAGCGHNYNVAEIRIPEKGIHLPPLLPKQEGHCDHCNGTLHQRADDTEETVRHRLQVWREMSTPVMDFYRQQQTNDGRRWLDFDVTEGKKACGPRLIAEVEDLRAAIRSGQEQERWAAAKRPDDGWGDDPPLASFC